jgi:hypothetical protein
MIPPSYSSPCHERSMQQTFLPNNHNFDPDQTGLLTRKLG